MKTNMLAGLGEIYANEMNYELRRWIIMEVISFESSDIDANEGFINKFTPPDSLFFSPSVSAMMSVFNFTYDWNGFNQRKSQSTNNGNDSSTRFFSLYNILDELTYANCFRNCFNH